MQNWGQFQIVFSFPCRTEANFRYWTFLKMKPDLRTLTEELATTGGKCLSYSTLGDGRQRKRQSWAHWNIVATTWDRFKAKQIVTCHWTELLTIVSKLHSQEETFVVSLSHCRIAACRIVALSHCRIAALSHCRIVALSHCRIVALPHCRIVATLKNCSKPSSDLKNKYCLMINNYQLKFGTCNAYDEE